jgi:hypothetical protein
MPLVKNRTTEQNRRFWSHVEQVARETEVLLREEQRQGSQTCPSAGQDEHDPRSESGGSRND